MNKTRSLIVLLCAGLLAGATLQAYDVGGVAFTKKVETSLLAEPKAGASAVGKLGFGRQVKISQKQGAWLKVSEGATAGWVFGGNLSATKPEGDRGLDAPLLASDTTATAAARPLSEEANAYAERRNLGNARDDLDWMLNECRLVSPAAVQAYLRANKKGENQ